LVDSFFQGLIWFSHGLFNLYTQTVVHFWLCESQSPCVKIESPRFAASGVDSPKILGGAKYFEFKLTTMFGLGQLLSNQKKTKYARNLGRNDPFGTLATIMFAASFREISRMGFSFITLQ